METNALFLIFTFIYQPIRMKELLILLNFSSSWLKANRLFSLWTRFQENYCLGSLTFKCCLTWNSFSNNVKRAAKSKSLFQTVLFIHLLQHRCIRIQKIKQIHRHKKCFFESLTFFHTAFRPVSCVWYIFFNSSVCHKTVYLTL